MPKNRIFRIFELGIRYGENTYICEREGMPKMVENCKEKIQYTPILHKVAEKGAF